MKVPYSSSGIWVAQYFLTLLPKKVSIPTNETNSSQSIPQCWGTAGTAVNLLNQSLVCPTVSIATLVLRMLSKKAPAGYNYIDGSDMRLEAIGSRLEAIATSVEAIATRMDAIRS